MSFLLNNYLEILAAFSLLVGVATSITALTPSKRDDEIVSKVRKVVDFLSLRLLKK